MTHWTSTTVAWRLDWSAGSATLTTVLSMNAMLEPRMVAARIQGPASGRQGARSRPVRMMASSQGGRIGVWMLREYNAVHCVTIPSGCKLSAMAMDFYIYGAIGGLAA